MNDVILGETLFVIRLKDGHGAWRLSEDHLRECFQRMAGDGSLNRVFYDGAVTSEDDFIRLMASPGREFFMLYTGSGRPEKSAGFFWLSGFQGRTAYLHFCLFRDHWGRLAGDIARQVLKRLMTAADEKGERFFHAIRGSTPVSNRMAIRFLNSCGFRPLGILPQAAFIKKEERYVDCLESVFES